MDYQKVSLSYGARREVLARMAPSYQEATGAQKMLLLDHLVEMMGYARKYTIGLPHQELRGSSSTLRKPRQPRYGSEVQQALFVAWQASRYICAKRLMPFLPSLIADLDRFGHVQLSKERRSTEANCSQSVSPLPGGTGGPNAHFPANRTERSASERKELCQEEKT